MPTKQLTEEDMIALMGHSIYRRATMMHMLLTGYSLFISIQIRKGCTNSNLTYADAEYIADKYTEITGMEVVPSQFLHDKNQLANELIEDYQKLQELLNTSFHETMRPIVMSFYHHLYYYRRILADRLMPVQVGLAAFLNYASGSIDIEEMKRNFIAFDVIHMKVIQIDSMYIRHNLMAFEDDFNEICVKRAIRELLKSGKGPCSNFTIDITI